MRSRLSFLAFVAYIALDLSNPFVAGAFNFNPDECVEVAQREHRTLMVAASADHAGQRLSATQLQARRVARRAPMPDPRADRRTPAPVVHAVASSPPSPSEDH